MSSPISVRSVNRYGDGAAAAFGSLDSGDTAEFSWNDWEFSAPAPLAAHTTYWIVCWSTGVTTANCYFSLMNNPGNMYHNGMRASYAIPPDTSWITNDTSDICFRLYR